MKPFNRFDLEQQIMNCWNVCEDLETVCEGVLEREINQDQISNVLLGMKELYQLKFEKLWENFEALCHEQVQVKKYHDAYDNMSVQTAHGEYLNESD
jgi:hypothetical protein